MQGSIQLCTVLKQSLLSQELQDGWVFVIVVVVVFYPQFLHHPELFVLFSLLWPMLPL